MCALADYSMAIARNFKMCRRWLKSAFLSSGNDDKYLGESNKIIHMNAKDPEFTILALKCITGKAHQEEKTRLEVLLHNDELMREYQELGKIVGIVSQLKDLK
jgi:hypothetical protein